MIEAVDKIDDQDDVMNIYIGKGDLYKKHINAMNKINDDIPNIAVKSKTTIEC
jgi:hypothetical protein